MLRDNKRCDGLIGDYCDGHFITGNSYFQDVPNALQLVMYYDEVETCDVLASHRGVHKLGIVFTYSKYNVHWFHVLGVFYYTIANLRPALRSTHRSIQLIAVVTHPLLKKYGFGEILNSFVKDVKTLYEV